MLKELKTIETLVRYTNPYWEYRNDKYSLPSGGIGDYHYVNSRGATMIIPRLNSDLFVMTNQYRYLNKKTSIEFPGGGLAEGLSYSANALSELKEETGYLTADFVLIGEFNPYNGVTNEICQIFLADNLVKCSAQPDDTEEFEILELSKNDIINKINKGEIWDGMTLAAWSIYMMKESNI